MKEKEDWEKIAKELFPFLQRKLREFGDPETKLKKKKFIVDEEIINLAALWNKITFSITFLLYLTKHCKLSCEITWYFRVFHGQKIDMF